MALLFFSSCTFLQVFNCIVFLWHWIHDEAKFEQPMFLSSRMDSKKYPVAKLTNALQSQVMTLETYLDNFPISSISGSVVLYVQRYVCMYVCM